MKTILLIFSAFLLPISLFGQTDVSKSESNPLLKSTNAVKLRLDSIRPISGVNYGSYSYFYDSKGNNIKSIEEKYHFDKRTVYCTYDSVGNLILIDWGGPYIEEFTYNSKGQILTIVGFTSYPIYGQTEDSTWYKNNKTEYIYDTIHNASSLTYYSAQPGGTWGYLESWVSFYNSLGDIEFLCPGPTLFYTPFTFNCEDNCEDKIVFRYDGRGNLASKIYYRRDSLNTPWTKYIKILFSYDSYSNLIEVINTSPPYNPPVVTSKSEYKYDNTYSFNDLYLPYIYDGLYNYHDLYRYGHGDIWKTDFMNHKRTERIDYTYDENSGQWVKGETYKYYYSEHTITGIEDTPKDELMVYPNPSKDYIIFDINTNNEPSIVELYDSQGRMVLKEEIPDDKQIQVKHLQRGLYIYLLNYDNTIKTGKIILQ